MAGRASRCHSRAWRHASRRIRRPIGAIRPVSSASGMKSPGSTSPRRGWNQRASASTATTRPVVEADDRLVVDADLVALDRLLERGRELVAPRGCACASPARRTRSAACRSLLAVYIATSALREQLVGRLASAAVAMPMLACIEHSRPWSDERRAQRCDDPVARRARRSLVVARPRAGRRTRRRRGGPPCRRRGRQPRRRSATSTSSSSPAAWPRLSLIVLKSSRSRKRTAAVRRPSIASASAAATCSAKSTRFGRPVSASW